MFLDCMTSVCTRPEGLRIVNMQTHSPTDIVLPSDQSVKMVDFLSTNKYPSFLGLWLHLKMSQENNMV